MKRICIALFAAALLSGCATPIPKSETIPVFSGKPAATIGIAVVDHRSFILDGDKEEWFEGIMRGSFAIPMSLMREGEFNEKPFAFYLSSKLKESMDNAGSKATVIDVPKGTPLEQAIGEVTKAQLDSGLVVMMHQSRYDIGPFNPEYGYYFDLVVLDRSGKTLARKQFHQLDQGMALSEKYNIFDMMSEIYKKKFDGFLSDPEIKGALTVAAAGA